MKYQLTTPFRTEFLFSILVHLCVLILIGYGMETVKEAKRDKYIAVELVQSGQGQGRRTKKPAAKPKETKPVEQPHPKPDEVLPEKPRYTEYSEEAPVMQYREDTSFSGEEDEHGEEGNGGSPFGSGAGDGDIHYEPFHRVSVLPSFKVQIDPVYPSSERAAGKETRVVVEVYINEQGGVDRVEIIKSGGKLFDEAVVSAVKVSSFSPAIMEGRLVAVRVKIPYTFKLK